VRAYPFEESACAPVCVFSFLFFLKKLDGWLLIERVEKKKNQPICSHTVTPGLPPTAQLGRLV
jgi:hypothetical protein